MVLLGVIILILLTVFVFVMIIWAIASNQSKMTKGEEYVQEAAPIIQTYATVIDKHVNNVMTGSYQMPGHYLEFIVKFRLDNGEEKETIATQEMYDMIQLGARDLLLTQNQYLVDFGGLFGDNLPEDTSQKQ